MHEVKPAVEYLDETVKKSKDWLNEQLEKLPRRICKEDLIEVFKSSFYRTYQLRMSINGLQDQLIEAQQNAAMH